MCDLTFLTSREVGSSTESEIRRKRRRKIKGASSKTGKSVLNFSDGNPEKRGNLEFSEFGTGF